MAKRLDWVDIAKGIGIFLMVMGHSGIPRSIHDWIYSFHMPFFFILSGFFFTAGKYAFGELVSRKARTILLPYVVFTIIIDLVRYLCSLFHLNVYSPLSPVNILLIGEELGATWFLYALFITEIIYYLLDKIISNRLYLGIIILALSLISYWFYKSDIHYPYKIEILGISLMYYWLGNLMSETNSKTGWIKSYVNNWGGAILFVTIFVADFVLATAIKPPINIRLNVLGIYLPSLLLVIIGTLLVFQMSFLFKRNKLISNFFRYIGEYSIVLIGFSQIVSHVMKAIFEVVNITGPIESLLRYLILWAILLLLIKFLSKNCPVIIGKSKK